MKSQFVVKAGIQDIVELMTDLHISRFYLQDHNKTKSWPLSLCQLKNFSTDTHPSVGRIESESEDRERKGIFQVAF